MVLPAKIPHADVDKLLAVGAGYGESVVTKATEHP
jgi:hypothetical protein